MYYNNVIMARKNANPNQIIRKDGNNCFVEVLKNSFEIGRVLMKFVTYDQSREVGDKFTNEIDIYLTFEQFFRISYDILDSRQLINGILKDKQIADEEAKKTGKTAYPKPRILTMGGTSAESLKAKGKSRPDGMGISRVLKMFAGMKLPIMFIAESGPGESDSKGLIVPKYGYKPEQKVMIGLSADDAKELFLLTREEIRSFLTAKAVMNMMNPPENNQTTQTQNRSGYQPQPQPQPQQPPMNNHTESDSLSNAMNPPVEEPPIAPPDDFPISDDLFGGPDDFFG